MFHYGLKTAIPRSSPPSHNAAALTPSPNKPPSIPLISSRHPHPSGNECSITDSRGGRSSSPKRVFASFNSRPSRGSNTSQGIRCSPFRAGFCSCSAKHTLCCRDIHPLKLVPHSLASTPRSSPPPHNAAALTPSPNNPPSILLISPRHPSPSGDECSTTDSRGGRSSSPERVFASFNSRPSRGSNTSLGIRCFPFSFRVLQLLC